MGQKLTVLTERKAWRRSRLIELIAQHFNDRQAEFARAAQIAPDLVSRYVNGSKGIGDDMRDKIEANTGHVGWLDSRGEQKEAAHRSPLISLSDHPNLLSVPCVKFKLSAGVSGFAIEPENGNGKPIFFRRDWFETNGYRPEKLFGVRVSGASMEPSLWDDDLVVINTDDVTPKDGEAFAINYEGELCIKRLCRDAGEWFANSDNADQRRFAPKRCTGEVKIIGRVVFKLSERV